MTKQKTDVYYRLGRKKFLSALSYILDGTDDEFIFSLGVENAVLGTDYSSVEAHNRIHFTRTLSEYHFGFTSSKSKVRKAVRTFIKENNIRLTDEV